MADGQSNTGKRSDPLDLQNKLFLWLDEYLYKGSDDLRDWRYRLKTYLEPVYLQEGKIASDMCDALLKKGKITLGNYGILIDTVKGINHPVAEDIKVKQKEIEDAMSKVNSSSNKHTVECDGDRPRGDTFKSWEINQAKGTQTVALMSDMTLMKIKEVPLELMFDFIAGGLNGKVLTDLALSLSLENIDVETVKDDFPDNVKEQFFQILYKWHCMKTTDSPMNELKNQLQRMECMDICDQIEEFDLNKYVCNKVIGPDEIVKERDFPTVSNGLNKKYPSLGRFLGVQQKDIEQIREDFKGNIREQTNQTLLKWKRKTVKVTRQTLCNGLVYIGHRDIVENLQTRWRSDN